jgi:hypothetical protein
VNSIFFHSFYVAFIIISTYNIINCHKITKHGIKRIRLSDELTWRKKAEA